MRNLPKILQQGLVGWWDSTGKDLSGNGNSGTLVNSPTKVRALQNDGLSYNGSNSNVVTTNTASLDITTGGVTLSAWINTSSATNQFIIVKDGSASGNIQYRLGVYSTFNPNFLVTNNFTGPDEALGPANSVPSGKWCLVTGTYNTADSKNRIYVNGILLNTANSPGRSSTTNPVIIGQRQTNAFPFNGKIINPMIWNRALSAQEIQLLHKSTFIV